MVFNIFTMDFNFFLMLRTGLLFIFTLFSFSVFGQSLERIAFKLSDSICACLPANTTDLKLLRNKIDSCHDVKFNQILNMVDSTEAQLLVQGNNLSQINKDLPQIFYNTCGKIKTAIAKELKKTMEKAGDKAFPVNFSGKDLKNPDKHLNNLIALEGKILKIEKNPSGRIYYLIKTDNQTLWTGLLFPSEHEEPGDTVKIFGYLTELHNPQEKFLKNKKYRIIALGLLNESKSVLAYNPAAYGQIKQWILGELP